MARHGVQVEPLQAAGDESDWLELVDQVEALTQAPDSEEKALEPESEPEALPQPQVQQTPEALERIREELQLHPVAPSLPSRKVGGSNGANVQMARAYGEMERSLRSAFEAGWNEGIKHALRESERMMNDQAIQADRSGFKPDEMAKGLEWMQAEASEAGRHTSRGPGRTSRARKGDLAELRRYYEDQGRRHLLSYLSHRPNWRDLLRKSNDQIREGVDHENNLRLSRQGWERILIELRSEVKRTNKLPES